MQISIATALRKAITGADITVSTPFPEIDRELYSQFKIIHCSRRRLVWATLQLLRTYIWGKLNRWFGVDLKWLIPEAELRAYVDTNLVVDLSGDMLTEDYGPHVAYSHYIPILFALFMNRPVVVCAQSIGPFKFTRAVARYLLRRACVISTRDKISYDYLKEIGVDNSKLYLTADTAFLLDSISKAEARVLLEREGFVPGERPVLGVSLSNLVERKYNADIPDPEGTKFATLIALVLDDLVKRYAFDVLFVPHVTGPGKSKDDRITGARIAEKMQSRAYVIKGDYTPSQLKGIIGLCHTFLGARMHANIAALSSGVPTMAIAYSHKTPGIMEMLGQKKYVLAIQDLGREQLLHGMELLLRERDVIRERLRQKISETRGEAGFNIKLIQDVLAGVEKC